jgi:hypothetical protein
MANSWYYVDGGSTSHTIFIVGTTTAQGVIRGSEKWGWQREQHIETTPNRRGHVWRAHSQGPGAYEIDVILNRNSNSYTALETAIGTWEDWHNPELGQGYIKRVTANAATRCLDCVPETPEWGDMVGNSITVHQVYTAAWPWWRTETASTANSAFDGATPVAVSCANGGDIPSPVYAVITGVIATPKITASDGTYIEVNKTTANADDTLIINCRPSGTNRLTVKYYAHGAGAGVFCGVTSASRPISHPTGTTNLTLTAASGTATIAFSWYLYYGSLY